MSEHTAPFDALVLVRAGALDAKQMLGDQLALLGVRFSATTLAALSRFGRGFGLPSSGDCQEIRRLTSSARPQPR